MVIPLLRKKSAKQYLTPSFREAPVPIMQTYIDIDKYSSESSSRHNVGGRRCLVWFSVAWMKLPAPTYQISNHQKLFGALWSDQKKIASIANCNFLPAKNRSACQTWGCSETTFVHSSFFLFFSFCSFFLSISPSLMGLLSCTLHKHWTFPRTLRKTCKFYQTWCNTAAQNMVSAAKQQFPCLLNLPWCSSTTTRRIRESAFYCCLLCTSKSFPSAVGGFFDKFLQHNICSARVQQHSLWVNLRFRLCITFTTSLFIFSSPSRSDIWNRA